MPDLRFYLDEPLDVEKKVEITDQEMHHMVHVMRVKENDTVELINGCGFLAKAQVQKIGKKSVELCITDLKHEPESSHHFILAQAIPRPSNLELILEKATELGVTDIWLFPSEKSEIKHLQERQIQRLELILVSAIKQSGRLYLPRLIVKEELADCFEPGAIGFFGDTHPLAPSIRQFLSCDKLHSNIIWMVGPEKGFSENERRVMTEKLELKGVRLHHNILRAETAAIAGLSILSINYL